MRKIMFALVALTLPITAACGMESTQKPIPQAGEITETTVPAPASIEVPTTAKPVVKAAKVSTCDQVREALLTGTPAQIDVAMRALKADTTADGTAREYADYYLGRDRTNPEMQEMDISLIRMSCTL
jgi:hypothetical protein